jgi:hypothetical protein
MIARLAFLITLNVSTSNCCFITAGYATATAQCYHSYRKDKRCNRHTDSQCRLESSTSRAACY